MSERGRGGAHTHWDEATLIEWALDGGVRAAAEDTAGCPVCAARVAELEGFFAHVRGVAARRASSLAQGHGSDRLRDLVDGVLARTTREDPGWRGDLRLVHGFLGARLRSSLLLRVAAASLLLHLAVIPVLAYYGLWRARPEGFSTGIVVPAPAPLFSDDVEPEHAVEPESLSDAFDDAFPEVIGVEPHEALRVPSARRWARYHLKHQGAPQPPDRVRADEHPAARWLAARSRTILAAGAPADVATLVEAPPRDALESVLRCEWLLDRWVLEERAEDELTRRVQASLEPVGSAERAEVRLLELGVLGRARAYGLAMASDLTKLERLASELESSPWAELARRLSARTLRPGAPLDAAWIAALGVAAGADLGRGPFGRSWLDWQE